MHLFSLNKWQYCAIIMAKLSNNGDKFNSEFRYSYNIAPYSVKIDV